MKAFLKQSASACLALGITLVAASSTQAQITVKVDSTKNWVGYINRFDLNDGYVGGQVFGLDQLRGNFVPNKAGATRLILQLNTNTYNPADSYWTDKKLEANTYVDVGTLYAGQDVTFVGTVESNSIPAGWTCEAVIKDFTAGYGSVVVTRQPLVAGGFSVFASIPAGHITQYGFIVYGTNVPPGSVESQQAASIVVDNADPSITGEPANQRAQVGGSAAFTVAAVSSGSLTYQWKRYGTNLLNAGGKFSGATSATLTINNAQADDDTTYTVTVTGAGTLESQPARLRVLSAVDFANWLNNPSFEQDYVTFGMVPDPWVNFTGSALLTEGDTFIYASAYHGTNVVQVYNGGEYSGIYQDRPATPGEIFTGDCWLWQSSLDPLTSIPTHEAFLEVQFWPVAGGPIAIHQSFLVTNSATMQDAWLHLEATNGVAAGYASTSTSNGKYLVAPPGTDRVRFQITAHAVGGGSGSVFVDAMRLLKKVPVTVTTSSTGGNITLSWPSALTSNYQVVYKNALSDPTWTEIGGLVVGDGTVKTVSYSTAVGNRFYSVLTR